MVVRDEPIHDWIIEAGRATGPAGILRDQPLIASEAVLEVQ
jgi:hypothetical protein